MALPLGTFSGGAGGGRLLYGGNGSGNGNGARVLERIKTFTYHATDHKLLLDVEADQTVGSVKDSMVGELLIQNTGNKPSFAILAYRLWTSATAMSATTYHINYLLKPGEYIIVPDSPAVIADETIEQLAGTVVTNEAPDSNMYSNSGADTTEGFADDNDTTITFDDGSGAVAHTMFKVNDLIRLDNEVCRITSIVDTAGDGAYTPAHFVVDRAVYGTTKADHTNNTDIRFPFFNAYHDYDKFSVAQTDEQGRFKCFNLMGKGRAATGTQGITPGSFAMKFYQSGYQELGLTNVTPTQSTGLVASGSYWFKIAIDGGTAESINFTVDSSVTSWGGVNGVLSKIQTALDDKYNNKDSNTFNKKSRVGIVGNDVRFTSGSHLSTSAIALTAGVDGASAAYNIFAQQNGWTPALANIDAAVAARLPDDTLYDRITYDSAPNERAFCYDDGFGNLIGACGGSINYETGALDLVNAPPNAEFVFSCLHSSAFSGKQNATNASKMNSLKAIYGNLPNQKGIGELTITRS